jgi:PAS domain S-box-containing protein
MPSGTDRSRIGDLGPLHLAAIVAGSDDAIFSKNLDGVILSWNSGAERMYGYSAQEVVGRPVSVLVPEDLRPDLAGIMERIRNDQPVDHYQTRRRRKNGEIFDVSVTISPVKDEQGQVIGASAIARDITDRIQAEEMARIRTRELEQANSQLRRVNAELERFAYVAAHDLKEPLRTIATYSELLKARYGNRLDPDADEIIGYVVSAAVRLHDLIRDLLTFSRVGQRREVATVDANAVLSAVQADLEASIAERRAEVTSDPLPLVRIDRTELQQVFQNLLENALKFCAGSPRVHVSASTFDGWARFAVQDNGIGIDRGQKDRVFVLFQRLKPAEYAGTGVGLAICRKIVDASGGRIWVEDAPEQGCIFRFTLPAGSP